MKSITVRRDDGVVLLYAVNEENEGLFMRFPHENGYRQIAGTMQFQARTRQELSRKMHRRGGTFRVIDYYGWDDEQ